MKIIGLTGGIACGKSTASNYLKELGAIIINGDIISKEIITNQKVINELASVFGKDILLTKREVNRKKLGELVFNDKQELNKLNKIMHHHIEERINAYINHYKNNQFKGILILDMPLLIEIKLFERIKMDEIWLVSVQHDIQLKRLMERNNFTKEMADVRINSQLSLKEKIKYADLILDNSLDKEFLINQIQENYKRLICNPNYI